MRHLKIGITQGDMNGVCYEVIMKVLSDSKVYDGKTFVVYGSPKAAAYHRKSLDLPNFNFNLVTSAEEAAPKRPNIIDCVSEDVHVEPGMPTAESAKAAFQALKTAADDLKNGKIDILITMPIDKESIAKAGIEFQNHTEYLAKTFGTTQHTELFVNDAINVCYVSPAKNIAKVASSITHDAILQKIVALNDSMRVDFGISKPKIAVLALNSEISDEEKNIIVKAVDDAKTNGFVAVGPYLAESFFATAEYKNFDGVVGMYRDQVAIPFKALTYDDSLSFSLGLPKICVSPVMSVDYALVDKNSANEAPLSHAIFSSCDLLYRREQYAELTKNQLK